ncbi:Maturase [Dirofilaria immitis]
MDLHDKRAKYNFYVMRASGIYVVAQVEPVHSRANRTRSMVAQVKIENEWIGFSGGYANGTRMIVAQTRLVRRCVHMGLVGSRKWDLCDGYAKATFTVVHVMHARGIYEIAKMGLVRW